MLNASTSTLMWRSASETLSEQDVMNTHENEQNFYKRLQCRAVALGAVISDNCETTYPESNFFWAVEKDKWQNMML